MRIAVVGSGISGISAAWLLSPHHEVDVYEAADRLGGHAHTTDVVVNGQEGPVDTGFMVFNDRTYPNLTRFFERLGVHSSEAEMSFSVQSPAEGIEWSGSGLGGVFSQPSNVVNPRFLGMLKDIVRLSASADRLLADPQVTHLTLGELLEQEGYGRGFTDWYLLPMGSAIWSTPAGRMLEFPASTFLRFFDNHGLLHVTGKPTWRSVVGGSRTYVAAASASISGEIRLSTPVSRVERHDSLVRVTSSDGAQSYDAVVMATHADQACSIMQDMSPLEEETLLAFGKSRNRCLLHTDASLLPKSDRAHAAWNYYRVALPGGTAEVSLTYYINRLQQIGISDPVLVTLNPVSEPADGSLLAEYVYEHPLFTSAAIRAQERLPRLQGVGGVWYAGAWQRYGFHEDGILSAVRVAEALGVPLPWGGELDRTRTRALA